MEEKEQPVAEAIGEFRAEIRNLCGRIDELRDNNHREHKQVRDSIQALDDRLNAHLEKYGDLRVEVAKVSAFVGVILMGAWEALKHTFTRNP